MNTPCTLRLEGAHLGRMGNAAWSGALPGLVLLAAWLCLGLGASALQAGTKVWSNANNTNQWGDANNWSPVGVPVAGDAVEFDGSVSIANCTAAANTVAQNLASLTLKANYSGILTFSVDFAGGSSQTLVLTGPIVQNGGTWIVNGKSATGSGVILQATGFSQGAGAVLHSDARGYSGGSGPGASTGQVSSSHGGRGSPLVSSPAPYGSPTAPLTLGSGNGTSGAAGGGAIKIEVGGGLVLDGTLRANGGSSGSNNGAGSGGSLWLVCGTFAGTGLLQADGGNGGANSGGGGRIAVQYASSTFSGTFRCAAGTAAGTPGVPGTLSLPAGADLTVKADLGLAPGAQTYGNLLVKAGKRLVLHGAQTGSGASAVAVPCLISAGSLNVEATGLVTADFEGFLTNSGPAAGSGTSYGASHGGRGANNLTRFEYGSASNPQTFGSGSQDTFGGGLVWIDLGSGTLRVDGTISANGGSSTFNYGGAAGGSVNLKCGTLLGSGLIRADGGGSGASGGGGGRLAVQGSLASYSGFFSCAGGASAGTVGRPGTLEVPVGSSLDLKYPVGLAPGAHTLGQVTVRNGGTLCFHGTQTGSGATAVGVASTLLAASLNVAVGGKVDADGEGFRPGSGPASGSGTGSAASHGGRGHAGPNPYGSSTDPLTFGSGNMNMGGGAVIIDTGGGTMRVDGTITANGFSEGNNYGGTAGGSINLRCGTLLGAGLLRARGGNSNLHGGGGGRIALRYTSSAFTGDTDCSGGVAGSNPGDKGSVTPGNLLVANHASGQLGDQFAAAGNYPNTPLYRFSLRTNGNAFTAAFEPLQVTRLVFDLLKVGGIRSSEITNIRLFRDSNNDGSTAGETALAAVSTLGISAVTGTLALDLAPGVLVVDNNASRIHFILQAEVANVDLGDKLTLDLKLKEAKLVANGTVIGAQALEAHALNSAGFAELAAGSGGAPAAVTHLIPGNSAPVAVADAYTVVEDVLLSVPVGSGLLQNDGDAEDDPLVAVRLSGPSHGTLTLNPNGSFTYRSDNNFVGVDSFTYAANDGTVNGNAVTVTITVTTLNDPPVAVADSYTILNDRVLNVAAPGVLANDSDAELDPLSAVLLSGPASGTLALQPSGAFSYTPAAGFVGVASFVYAANDGIFNSAPVTVSIQVLPALTVTAVATPTVLVAGNSTALASTPAGGSGSYSSFSWSGPHGFGSSAQNPGAVKLGEAGFYLFQVTVTDSLGFSASGSVSVAVLGSALAANPVASPSLLQLGQGTQLGCNPTGGSGVYVAFSWSGPGGFGSSLQNPGLVAPKHPGAHTFTVTVTDAAGLSATDSVTVVVGEPLNSLFLADGGARYRVTSASSPETPLDYFRVVVQGLELGEGDRLAFVFHSAAIGDLTRQDGLTLDTKLRARGQLGVAPSLFTDCRARYQAKNRRLLLIARRGVSPSQGQPLVASESGTVANVAVAVLVDRAPADGIIDTAAIVPVQFQVKVTATGEGLLVEQGKGRR